MKITKSVLLISFLIIFLFSLFICPVYADENYTEIGVYDYADILSNNEEKSLQKISQKYYKNDISVIFLTTNDTEGKTVGEYADKFYINNNFHPDSVMFIISKDPLNHQIFIHPTGTYIETFSSASIKEVLESTKNLAITERYYDFFVKIEEESSSYIKNIDALIAKLIPSKMSIAISFASVVCVILILFNLHNKANTKPKAQIYLNQSFKVLYCHEVFLGDEKEIIKDYYKKDDIQPTFPNNKFNNRFGKF